MRLTGFGYLRRRRVVTLLMVVAFSSMLFTMTATSLLGFYRGFTAYLGEGENILVIYDRNSRAPFTGLVPAFLADSVRAVDGVQASSAEVIAPCVLKGDSVFLRGVVPEDFARLSQLTVIEGEMIGLEDLSWMVVGRNVAERLGLNLNDRVLVTGILSDRYLDLKVKGVFASHTSMDDEVIAPIYVGQWLRGAGYAQATLIRVKIDAGKVSKTDVLKAISEEASGQPSQPSQGEKPPQGPIIPGIVTRLRAGEIGVEEAAAFMKSYMDRFGVTRESLLTLSLAVFFFSSASIVLGYKTLMAQHRGEMDVLRSLGASKRFLKADLMAKLLPWSILASSIGMFVGLATLAAIQGRGYLRVLSHTVPVQVDPLVITINLGLTILLLSLTILGSELR
jgi:ABC-type lipoprotein release transport system permease subunit